MKIYSRAEWGSQASDLTAQTVAKNGTVFIHHSVSDLPKGATVAQEMAHLRALERGHLAQGWKAIGYSYIVFPSGRAYEGRGFFNVPAAQLNNNTGNGAICFVGNFENGWTTWSARLTAVRLARKFPGARMRGHRDVFLTSCPGSHLYGELPRLRVLANKTS